jgi:hypothetical protein
LGNLIKNFKQFSNEKDGKYYQDDSTVDHKIRTPNPMHLMERFICLQYLKIASAVCLHQWLPEKKTQ